MLISYLYRAICALYDGLSPEVANEAMFPSDDEFKDLEEKLGQFIPQEKNGTLKSDVLEGVCERDIHIVLLPTNCS